MLHDASYNKEKISLALSECANWISSLNLLKEESNALKTKLSEALDHHTEKDLVAEAENFHNLILVRDEYIRDITTDSKTQEKRLKDNLIRSAADKHWITQQQKLRHEVNFLQKDFANMREDFYRKFLKKIHS